MMRQAIARTATPALRRTTARAVAFSSRAVTRGGGTTQGAVAAPRPTSIFDEMFASDPFFQDPFFRPFLGRGFGGHMGAGAAGGGGDVAPMGLDISETPTHFVVKAELPGIKKEDCKITLHDGVLSIEAERKQEASGEDKDTKVHYTDFSYGKLTRSLRLPDTADASDVAAEMQDGVLKVSVKRAEHMQPKQIDIK